MKAADTILKRGDFILIYPEQSLWWNYEKPKPLKNGAYKIASRSNVPVIPIFITMKDSDIRILCSYRKANLSRCYIIRKRECRRNEK